MVTDFFQCTITDVGAIGPDRARGGAGQHDVPDHNDYWTKLKAFVDYEPVTAITPELRGVLASMGIIKGEPFEPTTRQQELLQKAVETAPKMILALRQLGREDGRNLYYVVPVMRIAGTAMRSSWPTGDRVR